MFHEHEWQHSANPRSLASRLLEPIARRVDLDLVLPVTVVRTPYLEAPTLKRGAEYTSASVIEPISKLHSLQSLSLTHSKVTNENIAQLAHLRKLETLDLHMSKMHEGPIPGLDQLRLKTLYLNRTRINDESIAGLRTMDTLEHLDLTRTKITDEGLSHLASLANLRKLILRRSLVTKAGFLAFQQAHPKISVSWEPLRR